ncbi:MAG: NAD-dependent epimerase/dehydratase family protein [Eubacterium sp.]|nr:NAD-dependent epimerase/dehydratase family protein [Eubacterium sp.]
MKKILVTGGTVFVSKTVAEYFAARDYDVYVLNRDTKTQIKNAKLIRADRNDLGDALKGMHFDAVLDVTAYTKQDISDLLDGLDSFDDYIMVSSSAVYPETGKQPFAEEEPVGENRFWGPYGTNKIEAEQELQSRVPGAYILRPPYLYGKYNNVYREAFIFDCAMQKRPFYLPKNGEMKLQFFHAKDLARLMEMILEKKPEQHIFNVGNKEAITVKEWVELCYDIVGTKLETVPVMEDIWQREYFCFADYEYYLDVTKQDALLDQVVPMREGLEEAYAWYQGNQQDVGKRPYLDFIDQRWKN